MHTPHARAQIRTRASACTHPHGVSLHSSKLRHCSSAHACAHARHTHTRIYRPANALPAASQQFQHTSPHTQTGGREMHQTVRPRQHANNARLAPLPHHRCRDIPRPRQDRYTYACAHAHTLVLLGQQDSAAKVALLASYTNPNRTRTRTHACDTPNPSQRGLARTALLPEPVPNTHSTRCATRNRATCPKPRRRNRTTLVAHRGTQRTTSLPHRPHRPSQFLRSPAERRYRMPTRPHAEPRQTSRARTDTLRRQLSHEKAPPPCSGPDTQNPNRRRIPHTQHDGTAVDPASGTEATKPIRARGRTFGADSRRTARTRPHSKPDPSRPLQGRPHPIFNRSSHTLIPPVPCAPDIHHTPPSIAHPAPFPDAPTRSPQTPTLKPVPKQGVRVLAAWPGASHGTAATRHRARGHLLFSEKAA